jgi:serine phosphatase RsbU (regulator of sigma subunit)
MVIIGFLFYNRYTLRNKLNQQLEMQNRQIAEKNQDITNSITYAQRIQNAIIPSAKSVNRIFPENFILYRPKDIVAGDFYWCEEVGNRRFIAVADCTGHGVPGAMVSVVCSNALNRAVFEFNITEPGRILDKTRELIVETFSKNDEKVNDGMDISLLCFDGDKVSWSGANNSLVYVTNGVLKEIKAHKQPIGKSLINTPFPTHHMRLEQGTVFYLFSDGYADQFGGKDGKKFMYRNLLKEFHEISSLPLKEQGERLDMHFQSWRGPLEQLDDVCVIGIRS